MTPTIPRAWGAGGASEAKTKMPNYVIIAPSDSDLSEGDVQAKFERWLTIVPGHVWAVSTTISTCSDVRDSLRSKSDIGKTCVIVKANEYNGYARRDLWEKLEAWERG